MSTSQHPIAYRLERQVGGATKLLATVMALPLVDGIFPALLLAGALDSTAGILQVGLLVFGGSATVAVILAEMDGSPREQVTAVLLVGAFIVPVAGLEAALAPSIERLLDLAVFERFAALVIAAVAAKTASARIGEYLPSPGVIIGLGMLASLQPAGAKLVILSDAALYGSVLRAVAAASVGVAFALGVAAFAPHLREWVEVDRFRFGSAVALGVLALAVLGLAPENAPLAVLAVAALLAFDPDGRQAPTDAKTTVTDGGDEDGAGDGAMGRQPWL
jgi:hypothetical protein